MKDNENDEKMKRNFEFYSNQKILEGLGSIEKLEQKLRNEMENNQNTDLNKDMKHLIGIHRSDLAFQLEEEVDMNNQIDFLTGNSSKSNLIFVDSKEYPPIIEKYFPFKKRMMINAITKETMQFVDEYVNSDQHENSKTILLIHGNASWSFTWRKVISNLKKSDKNLRIIAPDLMGFGFSSRLNFRRHSMEMHLNNVLQLILGLELKNIILVGCEWGGLISNLLAARLPSRIEGVIMMNNLDIIPQLFEHSNSIFSKIYKKSVHFPVVRMLFFHASKAPFDYFNQDFKMNKEEKEAHDLPFMGWSDRSSILGLAHLLPHQKNGTNKMIEESLQWAQENRNPFHILLPNNFNSHSFDSIMEKIRLCYPSAHITYSRTNSKSIQEEDSLSISNLILSTISKKISKL